MVGAVAPFVDGAAVGVGGSAWSRARISGTSTPPMSFITCNIGGRLRAMLCRNADVFDPAPVPLPPPSHTTTLSNLMFEIAFADASASLSRCSSINIWNAGWRRRTPG